MGTDEDRTHRIGVVEDHAVAVAGLRQILSADPSLVIVAAAATVADLLADTTDLDLAILDLRLPDGSSPITNVEQLRNEGIETLVFTSGDEPFLVRAAARAGVLGVVRKSERDEVVVAAVRDAVQGRMVPTLDWAAAIDGDSDFVAGEPEPAAARSAQPLRLRRAGGPRGAHDRADRGHRQRLPRSHPAEVRRGGTAGAHQDGPVQARVGGRMAADTAARPLTPESAGGSAERRLTNLFFLFLSSGYLALPGYPGSVDRGAGGAHRAVVVGPGPHPRVRPARRDGNRRIAQASACGRAGPRRRALSCSSLPP